MCNFDWQQQKKILCKNGRLNILCDSFMEPEYT